MRPSPKNQAWSPRQKAAIHHYATAAGLIVGRGSDQDKTAYRQFLQQWTFLGRFPQGAITAADRRLTQDDFDTVMPRLETLVWQRVDAGLIAPPATGRGKPYTRTYWRDRCLQPSRQRHAVQTRFRALLDLRPDLGPHYLDGIAAKATHGQLASWQDADRGQLAMIVNALDDHLLHAHRRSA